MQELCHLRSPSFLSFFLLFGPAKNLGQFIDAMDHGGASSRKREKEAAFVGCIWRSLWIWTSFVWHCDVIGLQTRPSKDADSELRCILYVASTHIIKWSNIVVKGFASGLLVWPLSLLFKIVAVLSDDNQYLLILSILYSHLVYSS